MQVQGTRKVGTQAGVSGTGTTLLAAGQEAVFSHGRLPGATYRLQFHRGFTLVQAGAIVDYLRELGITHCYASPLTTARPGSLHGYDIHDHSRLNPELGTPEEFTAFCNRLAGLGLSLVLDVVPNHMCISGGGNRWWQDVLENGQGSPYAGYFDIDWRPPTKPDLAGKVLLPILGDQYGRVLENQEIVVTYDDETFQLRYAETSLPLAARTWAVILQPALEELKGLLEEGHADLQELESIMTQVGHLPGPKQTAPEQVRARQREKEVIQRRLAALVQADQAVRRALDRSLLALNGRRGDPHSFDRLEQLLGQQCYRLSHWRVASDEINYRRFFDVNELAAIRVERPEVFAAVHELVLGLVAGGSVSGLRVDHVDGLADPEAYLNDLQAACRGAPGGDEGPFYLVVEKILEDGEELRPTWPVAGTTGYEFMNLVNELLVARPGRLAFNRLYERFTGEATPFADLVYECKQLIMRVAMAGQVQVLAANLDRISEQHRYSRDFTRESLRFALREVIACFPVYRSYVRPQLGQVGEDDQRHITQAVRQAKRRNPAVSASLFDFLAGVLLLVFPEGISEAQRDERRRFVLQFQQLTGPIMAKGLEDTACYRHYPLGSLAEVGANPERFGISSRYWHQQMKRRRRCWANAMSASSSHDTKRSEDVRARLNVLSELPREWERAIHEWRELNRCHKQQLEGYLAPDANAEYLLYQTLVGVWPLQPPADAGRLEMEERVRAYMHKATSEAKRYTSWINPNEDYDRALREFVAAVLAPGTDNRFLASLQAFVRPVAQAGLYNSLAQTLLKLAAPGVPDIYQGCELWDFSLVDPDNRRPVDYGLRQRLLASLRAEDAALPDLLAELMARPEDGRIKLLVTSRGLACRRRRARLFAAGDYRPLQALGSQRHHVIAFARTAGREAVVAVAGRFFTGLGAATRLPLGPEVWGDAAVALVEGLGPGTYRDALSGRTSEARRVGNRWLLPLAEVFAALPVALLERVP